ncbi:hypothetical protein ACHHV8_33535 [Paenibacillus sp. TAB 01]|uniref:hypothetical protein n=1 Tax=Paenibacillus sp. TAB 01 TaxID=3368988 RepID=UPI003752B97A
MSIVSQWKVEHNGTVYEAGVVITGLSPAEEKGLVDQGYAEFVDHIEENFPLTGEAFAKLSAPEQKDVLEANGMTPGSNAAERLAQYTEFLEEQAGSHDGS